MDWMGHISDALKHFQPFASAATVYGLFYFLDRHASLKANQAISRWIGERPSYTGNVGPALLELFDILYCYPFFRWKAFFRSASISVFVALLFVYASFQFMYEIAFFAPRLGIQWLEQIIGNIVADYVSLFVVRAWLSRTAGGPWLSVLAGFFVGPIVITGTYILWDVARFSILTWSFHLRYFGEDWQFWGGVWYDLLTNSFSTSKFLLVPAMFIYLWMPLLVCSTVIVRGLDPALRGIAWGMPLVRQGNTNPLRVIGIFAAGLTFVGTGIAALLIH